MLSDEVGTALGALLDASLALLAACDRKDLVSRVEGKSYFAFRLRGRGGRASRAVNSELFGMGSDGWRRFYGALKAGRSGRLDSGETAKALYTVAISFCACIDLLKSGDQKTPGTFFELLIGHVFCRRLGVRPKTRLPVLNLDMETDLPTDFICDLGPGRAKFHLPVKTSTRERVIQVWAHQRVLDGVYGTGRFLGTPVILTETKTDRVKGEVVEICLPDQWRIYQMHIARLARVYYLDVPKAYEPLNRVFPPVPVKSFGEFFAEADDIGA